MSRSNFETTPPAKTDTHARIEVMKSISGSMRSHRLLSRLLQVINRLNISLLSRLCIHKPFYISTSLLRQLAASNNATKCSMDNLHNRLTSDLDSKNEIFYYSYREDPQIIVELQSLVAKCYKLRKI